MNFRLPFWLAVGAALISTPAFSQAISPEATDRQILATIDRVPASPKTIDDLVKALDAARPDVEVIRKNQEIADAPPPEGANRTELWNFYRSRFVAAEALGRVQQMKDDCQKAIEFAPASNPEAVNDAHQSCIQADFNDGNPLAAIEKLKALLARRPHLGWYLSTQMLLVNAYRLVGDLEAAEKALREVDGTLVMLRLGSAWNEWGDHYTVQAERARGEFYLAVGRPIPAELAFARAIAANNARLEAIERGAFRNSTRRVHSKDSNLFVRGILLQRMGTALMFQRKLGEAEYYFRLSLKTYLGVIGKIAFMFQAY